MGFHGWSLKILKCSRPLLRIGFPRLKSHIDWLYLLQNKCSFYFCGWLTIVDMCENTFRFTNCWHFESVSSYIKQLMRAGCSYHTYLIMLWIQDNKTWEKVKRWHCNFQLSTKWTLMNLTQKFCFVFLKIYPVVTTTPAMLKMVL